MDIQSTKHILLLGAGFTKNFGGLLADEMWNEIFNHERIQAHPRIKKFMLNNFDYESIYHSVLEGVRDEKGTFLPSEFTDDEKDAVKDATKSAYTFIDENLRGHIINHSRPTHLYNVNNLMHTIGSHRQKNEIIIDGKTHFFSTDLTNKSFIFTLNQDLFFERLYSNNASAELSIPGIENNPEWFTTRFNKPLEPSDYCRLPTEYELKPMKDSLLEVGGYFLIKLHGSCNWISSNGSDDVMVIGKGKTEKIDNEPLLKHYFEIFDYVLSKGECRLLIIGYSFGDEHINRIISKAITDHGLKIYILSNLSSKILKEKLFEGSQVSKDIVNIWESISGYFPNVKETLEDTDFNLAKNKHLYDSFFDKQYII